jgi:hypothetical protein
VHDVTLFVAVHSFVTFCTFAFEFKEVWYKVSDTRCCITTLVIKEWRDVARDLLCRTILSWRHIIGMRGKHVNVSNVSKTKEWTATNNVTSCTTCSLPQSIVQICILFRQNSSEEKISCNVTPFFYHQCGDTTSCIRHLVSNFFKFKGKRAKC